MIQNRGYLVELKYSPTRKGKSAIKTDNAQKKYPDYLKLIDDFSNKYSASHGQVEMFIFEYGLNLK